MAGNRDFSSERFRELVILLSELSAKDEWFGATKLNKALYYCDFIAYQRLGKSITGALYQKLSEGPAPRELLREREAMIAAEDISVIQKPVFNYLQQRVQPLRPANRSLFTEDELRVILEVVRLLGPLTARQTSEMSHAEVGWAAAALGEEIPYVTAFLLAGPIPAEVELRVMGRL